MGINLTGVIDGMSNKPLGKPSRAMRRLEAARNYNLWDARRGLACWWCAKIGATCNKGGWRYAPAIRVFGVGRTFAMAKLRLGQGYGAIYARWRNEILAAFWGRS